MVLLYPFVSDFNKLKFFYFPYYSKKPLFLKTIVTLPKNLLITFEQQCRHCEKLLTKNTNSVQFGRVCDNLIILTSATELGSKYQRTGVTSAPNLGMTHMCMFGRRGAMCVLLADAKGRRESLTQCTKFRSHNRVLFRYEYPKGSYMCASILTRGNFTLNFETRVHQLFS